MQVFKCLYFLLALIKLLEDDFVSHIECSFFGGFGVVSYLSIALPFVPEVSGLHAESSISPQTPAPIRKCVHAICTIF